MRARSTGLTWRWSRVKSHTGLLCMPLYKMLTIHRQSTTRTLQLPPELLYKIITWVIAQSVHSICVSSDNVEWKLKLMETLCLVSSTFRDIALEVACKAIGLEGEENHPNYQRCVGDVRGCDSRCSIDFYFLIVAPHLLQSCLPVEHGTCIHAASSIKQIHNPRYLHS